LTKKAKAPAVKKSQKKRVTKKTVKKRGKGEI